MFGRSKLHLVYVVMDDDGRFLIGRGVWGAPEGNDMSDARIFRSRRGADRELQGLDRKGTIFEIGLYNGKPVMLVDAYDYWLDAKYAGIRAK